MSEELLLTDEEIENITDNIAATYIGDKGEKAEVGDLEAEVGRGIAQAQLAHCKPLIDAEWQKRLGEVLEKQSVLLSHYPSLKADLEDLKGATDG